MSSEFTAYLLITSFFWLAALMVIGPRRTIDLSRCVGWYLLVFYLTYMLRPMASQIMGDTSMFELLRMDPFENHWEVMVVAVSLAISFFAIGYRIGVRGETETISVDPADIPGPAEANTARKFAVALMVWGYVMLLVASLSGQQAGDVGEVGGATMGEYQHHTAYFMQSDVFVSTGSLLYYIMTGRLAFSLLLAAPWMMQRVMYGWGRSYLLGHFFGLMAMYFIRARAAGSRLKAKQVVMIGFGVLVVLCMFPFLGMMRGMKQQLGLNASSFSGDLVRMTMTQTDPLDMMQTYLGTNSAISGFENSYYHLTVDTRPKWGTVYLYQYIFQPIPRVLFPGKGDGYSWARDLLGVDVDPRVIAIGMAPGAVGGAFEEWGWIGIPAEFLFTGWLIGWAEKRARRKPRLPYVQVGYAGLYSMMQAMGRSPLLNWIAQRWAFGYGIPVVILWLVHRRAMERARTGRQRTARSVGSPMTASGSTA